MSKDSFYGKSFIITNNQFYMDESIFILTESVSSSMIITRLLCVSGMS